MTIEFNYNKKQVLRALRYHFFSKKDVRILLLVVNGFALASALLFYFKTVTPLAFLISSFLWITLMLSFWWILPLKIYRSSNTFREHLTISFRSDDMLITHSGGEKLWPYSSFRSMKETPDFFYLYVDERSFFLIPQDAFEVVEDSKSLRELLRKKIITS